MNQIPRIVAGATSMLFVLMGLGWWVAPARVGAQLGMPLLDGVGLSTQIADLASFFLTAGACGLIGSITRNRVWLHPAILLLGLAALGRILAWWVHGAALPYDMIAVEIVAAAVLAWASSTLTEPAAMETAP